MKPVIVEVRDLKKHFSVERPLISQFVNPFGKSEQVFALNGLSFRIEAGEVVGLVGPNGAGKTTLLRILADLLEPSGGTVKLCGKDVGKAGFRLRALVGYVPGNERSFFWRLSCRDNLRFFGRLYGLAGREIERRIEELLEMFGFEGEAGRLFRDYSAGMRKKVGVMRSLLHRPEILLLDEVTNSLDPGSSKAVIELVRDYVSRGEGRAALWSTHRLEETAGFCDRIIAIEEGVICYDGSSAGFCGDFLVDTDLSAGSKNIERGDRSISSDLSWPVKVETVSSNGNEQAGYSDI